jgi:hypothetical protein
MTFVSTAPIIAALLLAVTLVLKATAAARRPAWLLPAALSAAFLGFSLLAVWREGPTGFWPVHTSSLWGNQVWFDLLLAVWIGWVLILPRARAAGMAALPWAGLVLATGCIGFLAMLARLLWLEAKAAPGR